MNQFAVIVGSAVLLGLCWAEVGMQTRLAPGWAFDRPWRYRGAMSLGSLVAVAILTVSLFAFVGLVAHVGGL